MMGLPMSDLVISLFFLLALVLLSKFREQMRQADAESYSNVSAGIIILALVALARVYNDLGVFRSIPFVSDPLSYRLLTWIGIISGATFLVSGVSSWLPLWQAYLRNNQRRWKRLELIKKVEQLAGVETRLDAILSETLGHMAELYELPCGAVYTYSRERQEMILVSSFGESEASADDLRRVQFDNDVLQTWHNKTRPAELSAIRQLPKFLDRPTIVLPILAADCLHGVFLLWDGKDNQWDEGDRINLKITIDIIGRMIVLDRFRLESEFDRQCQDWKESVADAIDYHKGLRENVVQIARILTSRIGADYVSLAVSDDGRTVQRFSVGENRTILEERSLDLHDLTSHITTVFETGQPLAIDNIPEEKRVPIEDMIIDSGMKSLLALPLEHAGKVRGTITVAAGRTGPFSATEKALLESILPLLRTLIVDELHRAVLNSRERRASVLSGLLGEVSESNSLQTTFERVADILSSELKTAVVRISTFDYDGAFLKSRALSLQQAVQPAMPTDGSMILSLMPYHQLVRDTGRMMLINQENTDKKIDEAEAKQAFTADLKSALLIPVTVGGQVLAVIGLADLRDWGQYQYPHEDVLLAKSMASTLGLAIQSTLGHSRTTAATIGGVLSGELSQDFSSLRTSVKSSLTGILGSVEILKSRESSSDETIDRYLTIIDKSARRINECFTGDTVEP